MKRNRNLAHAFVASLGLLTLVSCTPGFEKWFKEQERIPHILVNVTEHNTDCEVSGAHITLANSPLSYETNWYGWCRLNKENGDSVSLRIVRDRFSPLDTILHFTDAVCDTFRLQIVRISADSSLDRSVSCAFRSGWEDAEQELHSDNASIFEAGGLRHTFLNVDKETGLPLRGNFSCMVDSRILGFAQGHNSKIIDWISQHGLPSNSKKRWFSIINDPHLFFDSLKTQGSVALLLKDSLGISSPSNSIKLTMVGESAKPDHSATLKIANLASNQVNWELISDDQKFAKVEVAWGPSDSRLVIIRTPKHWFIFNLQPVELLNHLWD